MDPADRKKREPPDPDGQPLNKRHALASSATSVHEENVDPKEAPVLLYQNKAMQIRLKEIKMEMQAQEETIKHLSEKQRLYDETLSCAHRTWGQLNDNSQKLLARLDFNYDGITKGETPGTTLTHLLFQTLEPLNDATQFDLALQQRMKSTQQIITRLVEAVEKERANNERITALLRDQAPAAIQEKLQQLENENKTLTSSLNKLQQAQQQAHASQSHTDNQNKSLLKQIEDLQAKFYQLETDLSVTRRKVIKQEIPLPVGVTARPITSSSSSLSSSSSSVTTTSSTNGTEHKLEGDNNNNNNNKTNGESSQEYSDLQVVAEKRLEELGKLQEEKVSLLKDITKLRDELNHLSLERVSTSEPFKKIERETKMLRDSLEREKDSANRLKNEVFQLRDLRKKDKEILERDESAKRRVMETQLRELQDTVTKLKLENNEILGRVESHMSTLPSDKYIGELKLLVASRDTDVKKLKDEINRLVAINKQLNERKGDKVEETLQSKLVEISDLQDKLKKLERDLEDFQRKEKTWTTREREYRAAVDSYQSSSKDRRDLHDLRLSERRFRDEAEDLRRERDDIRRAYDKSSARELEKKFAEDLKAAKADYEKATAKATYDVKELKKQLESKTEEYEMMIGEVDNISKAYEDMQAQNKRLMVDLGGKEDITTQVASEGIKMKRQLETMRIEARDTHERYLRTEERNKSQHSIIEDLELQVGAGQIKYAKVFEELQTIGLAMEAHRRDTQHAQNQSFELKQQVESLEKVAADARRKTEDLISELEKEKEKVRRLDEDKTSLKRKLDRAAPSKGGINLAEEELKGLKQTLTCNVCNDRMKDTVISKCFHVFCHECVATNLQIRKRRCPQCQAPFSNNDVHTLFGFV